MNSSNSKGMASNTFKASNEVMVENSNASYCRKFLLDKKFAVKEAKKALSRGGSSIYKLHLRITDGAKTLYERNNDRELDEVFASLMAWDRIINIIKPNEHRPSSPHQLKRDCSCMWNAIYKGWYDDYQPDNEEEFKVWFISVLGLACAKKSGLF